MVHLFVAEDSKLIRKVIKTIIEEYAADVIESTDNMVTVREFEQDKSKIMFLDIQLPDEKGLEAVYDIITSIPEAKIDVYKTDLREHIQKAEVKTIDVSKVEPKSVPRVVIKKDELDRILEMGVISAVKSTAQMLNKDLRFNIIQKKIVKKGNIVPFVPQTCLGVFYKLSGDTDGGTSLMFPLKDILATAGLFQLDFSVQEGTTQNIINELGNIFINNILGIINEKLHKKFSLGVPIPANGDNLEEHFRGVGRDDDDIVVIKFNFISEDKTIDSYLVLSIGRIIN